MTLRAALVTDLPRLQDIERAAGRMFAEIGMTFVADDEPPSTATLDEFRRDGRAWVATDGDDVPVAYLLADTVDGCAHLEQVSVDPAHAGRRLGVALLDRMITWARAQNLPAVTLTTYVDVAWNGPYYERLGFRYLTDDELTPGLVSIRRQEAAHGLDIRPRAGMRREL